MKISSTTHNTIYHFKLQILKLPVGLRISLFAWFSMRLVLNIWGIIIVGYTSPTNLFNSLYHGTQPLSSPIGIWQRWDAIHYYRIYQDGYSNNPLLSAFFPAYPFHGKLIGGILPGEGLLALLLVSDIAVIIGLVILYNLGTQLSSQKAAQYSVLALLFFPGAFFLFAPYADGLALTLTLLTFYSATKRKWLVSGIAGLIAGLTHPTVAPLVLGLGWLVVQSWRSSSPAERIGSLASSSTPILGLGLFLAWRISQGFPSYTSIQFQNWGWLLKPPWQIIHAIRNLPQNLFFPLSGWLNLIAFSITVLSVIGSWRHLPRSMAFYQTVGVILLLSTHREIEPLASWSRHSLLLFPTFLVLGNWLSERRYGSIKLIVLLCINLYAASLFFMWIWVG